MTRAIIDSYLQASLAPDYLAVSHSSSMAPLVWFDRRETFVVRRNHPDMQFSLPTRVKHRNTLA